MSIETHVQATASVGSNKYFADGITDLDYVKVGVKKCSTKSTQTIEPGSYVEFEGNALQGARVYLPKEMFLKVEFELVSKDGSPLPEPKEGDDYKEMKVALVNNTLHSFIANLDFRLGDHLV